MNKIIKAMSDHTSIRNFNKVEVTDEQLGMVLSSAMRGASAGNMMAYSVIKIRSKETLKRLSDSCDDQAFIGDASVALLFLVDSNKWHQLFKHRGVDKRFTTYKGPVISDYILAMQDTMIAAQNAVLAAESLGLGTCYIGDIMENYELHKDLFNLPKYVMPATLVVIGNYDHKPKVRSRFDQSYVVFDEVYPKIDSRFIEGMFAEEESKKSDFASKFYERKMNAPFFKEMERSIKLYMNEWHN